MTLPSDLAAALIERGYDRCTVYVTDDGILLRPYLSSNGSRPKRPAVALPEWSS